MCLHVNPSENCNFEIQVLLTQENWLKGLQHFASTKKSQRTKLVTLHILAHQSLWLARAVLPILISFPSLLCVNLFLFLLSLLDALGASQHLLSLFLLLNRLPFCCHLHFATEHSDFARLLNHFTAATVFPSLLSPLLTGFCVKMFYIKPVKYSGPIEKGEKIGVLLPMQRVYRGIISHVHIQNCDLTDPTPNL